MQGSPITLLTINRCSLNCAECCNRPLLKHNPNYVMSMGEVDTFITSAERNNYCLWVRLTGGEPTLWPHFVGAIQRLRESKSVASIDLFTNMAKPEVIFETLPLIDKVNVSHYPGYNDEIVSKCKYLEKFKIHGRSQFINWPKKDKGKGKSCRCPRPRVYDGKVWQFGNCLAAILHKHKGDISAIDSYDYLYKNISDPFLGFENNKPGRMDLCGFCVSRK